VSLVRSRACADQLHVHNSALGEAEHTDKGQQLALASVSSQLQGKRRHGVVGFHPGSLTGATCRRQGMSESFIDGSTGVPLGLGQTGRLQWKR
jgi:hypothetical protein